MNYSKDLGSNKKSILNSKNILWVRITNNNEMVLAIFQWLMTVLNLVENSYLNVKSTTKVY